MRRKNARNERGRKKKGRKELKKRARRVANREV